MIIFNVYFVASIIFSKRLRRLDMYPVAFQAFCDILIGQSLFRQKIAEIRDETGGTTLARPLMIQFANHCGAFKVIDEFLVRKLSVYSTGFCLLVIAIDRYIQVCHPFDSSRILSPRNRKVLAALLTTFVLGYTAMDFTCRCTRHECSNCY